MKKQSLLQVHVATLSEMGSRRMELGDGYDFNHMKPHGVYEIKSKENSDKKNLRVLINT